jgi:hypothetical protein
MINLDIPYLKEAIITIVVLFVIALVFIVLVRLFFKIMLFFLMKKYRHYKEKFKLKREEKFFRKEEEALQKDKVKEEEKFKSLELMDISEEEKDRIKEGIKQDIEEGRIVGVAEPVGFWTSLILGQKLTFLVNQAHAMEKEGKGFWVAMVNAHARSQERTRGRG